MSDRKVRRLYLIRHGQASLHRSVNDPDPSSYDTLSDLGKVQAQRLGAYFAAKNVAFDTSFVGPQKRHRETAELVQAAHASLGEMRQAGSPDEAPIQKIARSARIRIAPDSTGPEVIRAVLEAFVKWKEGELDVEEQYPAWREQIEALAQRILAADFVQAAFFTSSMIIFELLEIMRTGRPDLVHTSSFTIVEISPDGTFKVIEQNCTPHLSEDQLKYV